MLLDGSANDTDIELAARLTARFGKGRGAQTVSVEIADKQGVTQSLHVAPLAASDIPQEWYL